MPADAAGLDAVEDAAGAISDAPTSDDSLSPSDTGVAETGPTSDVDASPDVADAPDTPVALPSCPTAVIHITEGTQVVPQTVLHLRGDKSVAGGSAQVKSYLWTVQQPAHALAKLFPSPTFPNPTLTTNVAGTYQVCLSVTDTHGTPSCEVACTTVTVLPKAALYVELTWSTPGDPDPSDTGPAAGADMDLHFAHALAKGPDLDCDGEPDPWYVNPFDAFWFNPTPSWGSVDPAVYDDPQLLLDDTDGGGPELLTLDMPSNSHAIGVHYWNDHGFGVSTPTVRIYLLGKLFQAIQGPPMKPLDMWFVGRVSWPNLVSSPGSTTAPFTRCWQSGSPCDAGGKMWTETGQPCVRPCYVNPAFSATANMAQMPGCKAL